MRNGCYAFKCVTGGQWQPRCIAFGGVSVDETIAKEVLCVAQPAAVKAAILASEEETRKQDDVLDAWRRDLEAELERRWNQALQRVQEIELRIEQHVHGQGKATTPTREEFEDLAAKLEAVWNCPDADIRLKKRIVRTLIHEVVVDVDPSAGEVILVVHWKGGVHTELRVPRRRRGQNSAHTSQAIIDTVRVLTRICADEVIAGVLNRNGLLTGRGNRWTQERVSALRSHHGIPCYDADKCEAEGWMNLTEAANSLGVNPKTLRLAVERGEIEAEHPLGDGPWVFNRRAMETEAAAQFLARVRGSNRDPAISTSEQSTLGFSTT